MTLRLTHTSGLSYGRLGRITRLSLASKYVYSEQKGIWEADRSRGLEAGGRWVMTYFPTYQLRCLSKQERTQSHACLQLGECLQPDMGCAFSKPSKPLKKQSRRRRRSKAGRGVRKAGASEPHNSTQVRSTTAHLNACTLLMLNASEDSTAAHLNGIPSSSRKITEQHWP